MNSAIFSTGNQNYNIATVVYAGPVQEIPAERRRNEYTHYFKLLTALGPTFAYFKDVDAARKSRGALSGMLEVIKPRAFRYGNTFIDPSSVVALSNVIQFKKALGEFTHGFVVRVLTIDEKNQEVWVRYRSEDHARKGRKAMWAAMQAANGLSNTTKQAEETQPVVQEVAADGVPF